MRLIENSPGSQPTEIIESVPPAFAASSTDAKYAGIFAWVSKLSIVLKRAVIEQSIKTMPNYFSDYDTTVHFVTEETLKAEHNKMPHGGFVIRSGKTGKSDR